MRKSMAYVFGIGSISISNETKLPSQSWLLTNLISLHLFRT